MNGDGQTSVRAGYGIAFERNFGNVTYNVLFNPPQYLVASIDAPADVPFMPIFVDSAGPFGGVAGVTKTIPGGSLRHVDQNIETAYSHIYSAAFQRVFGGNITVSAEYSGSTGRKLYDLADINKPGAMMMFLGIGTSTSARPNTSYTAFNTPRQSRAVPVSRRNLQYRRAEVRPDGIAADGSATRSARPRTT